MQAYLGGGGASPYAAACANLAACLGNGTIPTAAAYAQAAQNYAYYLTYDLPAVGPTNLAPVVPADAYVLIETRFPYSLSVDQLDAILATTELPSGGALDNGSGWARLNLYAAAGGYGAFPSNVTVDMNAALGGFNAFDVWSNNISGPGGLTLQGSGTLVLAGDDTFTGGVNVQGGALGVTGSLLGPLSVSPGAAFVLGDTGVFTGVLTNDGSVDNEGVMTGTFAGSGAFANSGFLSGVGSFGSLDLLPGSTIALGNSIGAIQVADNLTVAAGATYQVKVAEDSADQIEVGGTATLSGGAVAASMLGASVEVGHAYPILVAAGGVNGAFANVSIDNLPFLQPLLSYDADDVFLTLARNGVSYASLATTPNQVAVADAAGAGPAGSGLDLALDVQSATGAPRAFDALSGEVYASAETAMLNDSLYLREALLARMRQASFAGASGPTAALASGGPTTTAYADDLGSSPAASALTNAGERKADDFARGPAGSRSGDLFLDPGDRFVGSDRRRRRRRHGEPLARRLVRRRRPSLRLPLAGRRRGRLHRLLRRRQRPRQRGRHRRRASGRLRGGQFRSLEPALSCGGELQRPRRHALARVSRLRRDGVRPLRRGHDASLQRGEL